MKISKIIILTLLGFIPFVTTQCESGSKGNSGVTTFTCGTLCQQLVSSGTLELESASAAVQAQCSSAGISDPIPAPSSISAPSFGNRTNVLTKTLYGDGGTGSSTAPTGVTAPTSLTGVTAQTSLTGVTITYFDNGTYTITVNGESDSGIWTQTDTRTILMQDSSGFTDTAFVDFESNGDVVISGMESGNCVEFTGTATGSQQVAQPDIVAPTPANNTDNSANDNNSTCGNLCQALVDKGFLLLYQDNAEITSGQCPNRFLGNPANEDPKLAIIFMDNGYYSMGSSVDNANTTGQWSEIDSKQISIEDPNGATITLFIDLSTSEVIMALDPQDPCTYAFFVPFTEQ